MRWSPLLDLIGFFREIAIGKIANKSLVDMKTQRYKSFKVIPISHNK